MNINLICFEESRTQADIREKYVMGFIRTFQRLANSGCRVLYLTMCHICCFASLDFECFGGFV